jgi:RNA polymerase sigma-54 factor
MRLDTTMTQRMDQRMILAPRMIQSMEILQLPIMALQERIEQELQDNPVLERQETPADESAGETPEAEAEEAPAPEPEPEADGEGDLDFSAFENLGRDWDDRYYEEHRPSRGTLDEEGDRKQDAMQNMPSRPQSLQDYLTEQLAFLDISPEQMLLVRFIITHIDERGFITVSTEDIAKSYDKPVTTAQVEVALAMVQKLEPLGVGARDYKECLLLQVTSETQHRDVVRVLIQNHLEDIAHNRLPIIQRRTAFDLETIKAAIEVIKHTLTLNPGAQFVSENIPYVVPDIAVDRDEQGEYTVRLLDDWTPSIYISRRYMGMYKDRAADQTTKEYLKRKIQAAQWLIESIEQRRNTLEKVTKAIIQHQRAFLDRGPEAIEPLKMQQIADQVGVHVTTVSRAVDDKWVQTPRGIFPLKRFFGGGTHTATGAEVAWETIKQKLLEIIDKEDKSNPLSDEDLVNKLQEVGYPVARRTVTKYRKMLKIPSSRQRKDWTENGMKHEGS